MKKLILVTLTVIVLLLLSSSYVFCVERTTTMPPTPAPKLKQVVGTTDAWIGQALFPEFFKPDPAAHYSDNPACEDYLVARYTDVARDSYEMYPADSNGIADTGLALSPIWLKSKNTGKNYFARTSDPGFVLVPGLQITGYPIPAEFRNTSKILVNWTIRIEGYKPDAYSVWPKLCSPWHGTHYERYPGGLAHTRLYVKAPGGNYKPYGPIASLNVPDAGMNVKTEPRDPTLSGSFLLTKDLFGGAFPASLDIQIRWYNTTAMKIKSPSNTRTLIITLMPITTSE